MRSIAALGVPQWTGYSEVQADFKWMLYSIMHWYGVVVVYSNGSSTWINCYMIVLPQKVKGVCTLIWDGKGAVLGGRMGGLRADE
jgi:hypothetical protein